MEESILKSVKKNLGLASTYTAFDDDVLTHINAAFSVLSQLGLGPVGGFSITSDTEVWEDFDVPEEQRHTTKSYIYLRVRMLFDPPTTSFHLDAMTKQIQEFEVRLTTWRDWLLNPVDPMEVV